MILTKNDRRILFVMATEIEYGAELQKRFAPLITGVGPVEAAVTLSATLATMKSRNALPDIVVSIGSAGSNTLEQGNIYQVQSVSYRDMDASALGFEKGATPFLEQSATIPITHKIKGLALATLSTGANVVSGAAYDAIDADMVDMETFAVLRCCQHFGVECVGLRGISDGKQDLRLYADWADALPALDRHLAKAVDLFLEQL